MQVRKRTVESGPAWVVGIWTNPGRGEEGWGMEISQLDPRQEATCTELRTHEWDPVVNLPLPCPGQDQEGRVEFVGGGQAVFRFY